MDMMDLRSADRDAALFCRLLDKVQPGIYRQRVLAGCAYPQDDAHSRHLG